MAAELTQKIGAVSTEAPAVIIGRKSPAVVHERKRMRNNLLLQDLMQLPSEKAQTPGITYDMMKDIEKSPLPIDLHDFQIKQGGGKIHGGGRKFPGIQLKICLSIKTDGLIILPSVLFHPLVFCFFIKMKPKSIIDPDNSVDSRIQFFHAVASGKKSCAADVGNGAANYLFGIENAFLCLCKLHICSILNWF